MRLLRPSSAIGAFLLATAACGPSATVNGDAGDGPGDPCGPGAQKCSGADFLVCNADNKFEVSEVCPNACDDRLGCVFCVPGTGTCNGADMSTMCKDDGSGYEDIFCDPLQGMSCNFETGVCDGDCTPLNIGRNYIGCEYYPTITGNAVGNNFAFSVAISNTTSNTANIHIEGGALTAPITLSVPPDSVVTQALPWIHELKLCTGPTSQDCLTPQVFGALKTDGAYHLRSSSPVTVYQFSPLEYTNGGLDFSYSNDASLLLPTNAWTGNYIAATWPRFDANAPDTWPGIMAVTAAHDGTQVTIATTATTNAGGGAPSFSPGAPQTVTLNAGDVLEIAAFGTYGSPLPDDLTGSMVTADKPVQLITAHYCTYIPDLNQGACDHLEESMFPIDALSTRYIVTPPAITNIPNGKEEVVRIVATEPNTLLEFNPPQPGVPTTIAAAGSFIEIPRQAADYMITTSQKVAVMQFMLGQDFVSNQGDPAMALAVPVDQYRTSYLFHAPTNYETNYVNVTAPDGATVFLDGNEVGAFTAIGSSGFGIARLQLDNGPTANGNHTITSTMPFGISVYGYGQYTSYWYPGGLDLAAIPVP